MTNATLNQNGGRLQKILDNNKFVFVLSLVIAFIVWVFVAMYASPDEEVTLSVPITIDMSNGIIEKNNYQVFGTYETSVDVTVSGPRYLISSLTSDDITVTAKTSSVEGAGLSSLSLSASVNENSDEIEIVELSLYSISVYFDVLSSQTYDVEVDTTKLEDLIAEGYVLYDVTPLTTTITLEGPQTELDKVNRVVVTPSSDSVLYESVTLEEVTVSLEGSTAEDTVTINTYIDFESTVNVRVSIWEEMELPLTVSLSGADTEYDVSIEPETALFIVDSEKVSDIASVTIGTIDCSNISEDDEEYTETITTDNLDLGSYVELIDESVTEFIVTLVPVSEDTEETEE